MLSWVLGKESQMMLNVVGRRCVEWHLVFSTHKKQTEKVQGKNLAAIHHMFRLYPSKYIELNQNKISNMSAISQTIILLFLRRGSFTQSTFSYVLLVEGHVPSIWHLEQWSHHFQQGHGLEQHSWYGNSLWAGWSRSNPSEGDNFHACSDQLWGPPSLLHNGCPIISEG